ncbi:MAG TPA: carboxypeptidase-like regulatory domain-containing protein, partial [Puia sp.]
MKVLIITLLIAFSSFSNAQTVIKGSVITDNNGPLESASISLLRNKDTIPFRNTITNREGRFNIPGVPAGMYYLRISAVGHGVVHGAAFTIKEGMK